MKQAFFVFAVVFCTLIGQAQAQAPRPDDVIIEHLRQARQSTDVRQQAPQEPGPYDEHCILVETFTIEVSTEALVRAGADIRDYQGISVNRLIAALADDENGSVKSGLKIRTGHDRRANVRKSGRRFLEMPRASDTINYSQYNFAHSCDIRGWIDQSGRILITFSYRDNYPIDSDDGAPPATHRWSFEGRLRTNSGEPHIVAATQNEETAMFVVFLTTLEGPEVTAETSSGQ